MKSDMVNHRTNAEQKADRPKPPVSRNLDLRRFDKMHIDIVKLKNSDTWALASGDFKAAFALWMAAWHQVPAGSLPNDERILAKLSEAGADWPNVRDIALRNFIECADGRLYHETVCEAAIEAGEKMEKYRKAGKASAAKRKIGQHRSNDAPTSPKHRSNVVGTSLQQGREEKRREEKPPLPPQTGSDPDSPTTVPAGLLEVGNEVLACIGVSESSYLGTFDLVAKWLRAGAVPETDIYPVVAAMAKRPNFAWKGSLKYFDDAVMEALNQRRAKAEDDAKGPPPNLLESETRDWWRVHGWAMRGSWMPEYGMPPPGDPDCPIPQHIIDDATAKGRAAGNRTKHDREV